MNDDEVNRSIIHRDKLPPLFRDPSALAAVLGTAWPPPSQPMGFLKKSWEGNFRIHGDSQLQRPGNRRGLPSRLPQLERALTDQLWNAERMVLKAARDNPATTTKNVDELSEDIRSDHHPQRALSWLMANTECQRRIRAAIRQSAATVFDTAIDIAYLKQAQAHVPELACNVIDTVTHMRWQFPGGAEPGKPIMERSETRLPPFTGFGGNLVNGRATTTMKKATTTMKKSKSASTEGKGAASPSQLIDARIKELGDWRGETLARIRASSSRPTPTWSRSGSGEGFRCGSTPESSAPARPTRPS